MFAVGALSFLEKVLAQCYFAGVVLITTRWAFGTGTYEKMSLVIPPALHAGALSCVEAFCVARGGSDALPVVENTRHSWSSFLRPPDRLLAVNSSSATNTPTYRWSWTILLATRLPVLVL